MKNRIVQQFRIWRAVNQATRGGQPDAIKKLFEENPGLKARFPDGQIERVLKGIGENKRLVELSQRPRQYAVSCGTGELACGLMWFGMAGSGLWSLLVPSSVGNGRIGMAITIACFLAGWFLLLAGKRLVVQPRIGYFALRPEKFRWAGMIVGMAVGMIVAVVIARWLATEHAQAARSAAKSIHQAVSTATVNLPATRKDIAIMAGTGVLNALLYLMVNAVSIRKHRWKWACLAVLLLIPPATIGWLSGDMAHRQLPMNFLQSLIWLASGSVTLAWFLRHHKPIAPEAE
jgi:hypothetical protein